MTMRIQQFDRDGNLLHTYDLKIGAREDMDTRVGSAIAALLRHSWAIAPGDCIRFNEV